MTMKNLKYFVMAMFAILASVSFSACSSDDDKDGGGSTGGSAFTTVDGRTVNYKYLYVVPLNEEDEFDTKNVAMYELDASTEDLLYYRQHPDKAKDNMFYSYMSTDLYVEDLNKEITEFDLWINYDCNLKRDVSLDDDDDDDDSKYPVASTHISYTTPDQGEFSSGTLKITKSGNTFKIATTEITVLASEMGEDEDECDFSRRTKCKLGFESSNLLSVNPGFDSPVKTIVVDDEADVRFLKSLTAKARKAARKSQVAK